jgi:DNA-binding transcriptional regulator YdaS (Cro superfamily)
MHKTEAIRLLGGTNAAAAEAIGITPSAVSQWPDVLPASIQDRVVAALARKHLPPELIGGQAQPAKAA